MELEGFANVRALCRQYRLDDANFLVGDLYASGAIGRWDAAYSSGYVSGYRQAVHDMEIPGRRRNPGTA